MGRVSFTVSLLAALAVSTAAQVPLAAQEYAYDPVAAQAERLSPRELDSLLAPIALYPDQLLAPILMAATYPHDVEAAAGWTSTAVNASLRGDSLAFALETYEWDPSVKTLAQFPDVLRMMDDEWDWMVRVGNAFYLQETDVMDSIQRLRHQSYAAGYLRSNEFQRVRFENGAVVIDMIDPASVYIPRYDPIRVYGFWSYPDLPPYYFHRPIVVSRYAVVPTLWGWSSWEWHRHRIRVDLPRYRYFSRHHPWRYNDDTWRHDRNRRDVNFRRDGSRGDWRGNDGRGFSGRGNDRREGAWDGRRDWDRQDRGAGDGERGNREGRRDRSGDRRADVTPGPDVTPAPSQPQGGDDEQRARRRFRGDGDQNAGRGFDGRPAFRERGQRQSYAGPQLTPPTPIAPMPREQGFRREERRQQFQERRESRREFRAQNSGGAPDANGGRSRPQFNGNAGGEGGFRGRPEGNGGGNREFRRGGGGGSNGGEGEGRRGNGRGRGNGNGNGRD
ncbi:MAG: DUF3300 domain-containing protein [Rhodospirillaceae bacterium]